MSFSLGNKLTKNKFCSDLKDVLQGVLLISNDTIFFKDKNVLGMFDS